MTPKNRWEILPWQEFCLPNLFAQHLDGLRTSCHRDTDTARF